MSVLVVHGEADTNVTPPYGEAAVAFWAENGLCGQGSSDSALDGDCVEFDDCADVDVVYCTPAGVQHEVWSPEGSQVLDAFLRRSFVSAP